ncbi:hypothetical protein ACFW5G_21325 [Streptomyces griseoaurantiacus]|uniref:hypothetical protein n=1 Tax=Streptomyces griseoaurantiacus TaxID=68213 RepID=UPI00368AF1CE
MRRSRALGGQAARDALDHRGDGHGRPRTGLVDLGHEDRDRHSGHRTDEPGTDALRRLPARSALE